ncbi:NAD-dependent DNA ligase LigA [Lacrimispora amygdalina]|uniref:DNA ligase n=1 Tax=Lacrimispora amygdalina TaxID=253257 RepID=A0A3E2N973_9FIRM|nr:NAD-dependent DNA ligase LigA [Clostridium indicum]RFZ77484.1 NAD-dependent DNA ligase LigA [Clostridium indicum]
MEANIFEKQRELTDRLNIHREKYYNHNAPSVSDEVYDRLFDELKALELQTGICMANSPTQTVGYSVVSKLEKTSHKIPLLSLDKTKSSEDLALFQGTQQIMFMLKLDGLTVKLTYENGRLVEAATRGDGEEGEVITHNTSGITGIPAQIPYTGHLVVTGEAFIRPADFEVLKAKLLDSSGKPYKNGRNLAAGSVRLLDAATCRERKVVFMPFGVLEGFPEMLTKSQKLSQLPAQGFSICKFLVSKRLLTRDEIEQAIQQLQQFADANGIPIDGIVMSYNDIAFSKICGRTGHHYKDGMAYKFEDELYESRLLHMEWTPTRFGEIAPVAVFDTVEIDGCEVSRASLHNLSFIEELELMPGNRILVCKRNMIIPHIEDNLDRSGFSLENVIPHECPCCGLPTRIHEGAGRTVDGEERITKTLFCDNPDCETRRLRRFVHFVSKKAMDIVGLSEATLEKLIGHGWIHTYMDIYRLDRHRDEIVQMDGFGEKSWQNLWDAIQQSQHTTFERYVIAMDIPMIGDNASKALRREFHGSLSNFEMAVYQEYDFTQLPDFGETLHNNIRDWFSEEENIYVWEELQKLLVIEEKVMEVLPNNGTSPFTGCTIVVTGKVEPYTREGINDLIESLGAHSGSSVSKKTDYLVCGEKAGSKLAKAQELGVPILTPAEFFQRANVA